MSRGQCNAEKVLLTQFSAQSALKPQAQLHFINDLMITARRWTLNVKIYVDPRAERVQYLIVAIGP